MKYNKQLILYRKVSYRSIIGCFIIFYRARINLVVIEIYATDLKAPGYLFFCLPDVHSLIVNRSTFIILFPTTTFRPLPVLRHPR